jgi:hypothetical protein
VLWLRARMVTLKLIASHAITDMEAKMFHLILGILGILAIFTLISSTLFGNNFTMKVLDVALDVFKFAFVMCLIYTAYLVVTGK